MMQDMIAPKKHGSIHDIPVGHRRQQTEPEYPQQSHRPRSGRRFFRFVIALIVIAIGCAAGAAISLYYFQGATVTIHPKSQMITSQLVVQAFPNASSGVLSYKVISVTRSATTTVSASGTQQVSTQATGVIAITNTYSTATQRLIANTRFAAPDGKIYRIRDSIVVPGMTKHSDNTIVPGSITATIYADAPGDVYNRTTPTQFTIPGFKGTPRYTGFSALSSGTISGGFVGNEPAVAAADLTKAKAILATKLTDAIRAAALSSVPSGSVGVEGTATASYSDIQQTLGSGNTAAISQSVVATFASVSTSDLASACAKQTVDGYNGEAVAFADPTKVSVSLASSTNKGSTGVLSIAVDNSPMMVWQFDKAALAQALLGKDRAAFQTIIQTFQPAIEKADASITPFWRQTFPTDPKKIKVKVEEPVGGI